MVQHGYMEKLVADKEFQRQSVRMVRAIGIKDGQKCFLSIMLPPRDLIRNPVGNLLAMNSMDISCAGTEHACMHAVST